MSAIEKNDTQAMDYVMGKAIADTLDASPRFEEGGVVYIAIDEDLARMWSGALRRIVERIKPDKSPQGSAT